MKVHLEDLEARIRADAATATRDHEIKREHLQATFKGAMEGVEARVREELGRLSVDHESKHKELKHTIQVHREGVDAKVADELSQFARDNEAKHREHPHKLKLAVDGMEAKFLQDMTHYSKEHDLKVSQYHTAMTAAHQHEIMNLREEMSRMNADHDVKHKEIRSMLPHHIDSLDSNLREEIGRALREWDSKLEKAQNHNSSSLESLDARLREEFQRTASDIDAKNKDQQTRTKSGMEALDHKFTEQLAQAARDQEARHDRAFHSLSSANDGLEAKVREEVAALGSADAKLKEQATRNRTSIEELELKLKDELLRLERDQEDKHQKGRHALAAHVESSKKQSEDILQSMFTSDAKHDEMRGVLQHSVQDMETRLRKELTRLERDHDGKLDSSRQQLYKVHSDLRDMVQDELAKMASDAEVKHRNHAAKANELSEAFDTRLVELAGQLTRAIDDKHEKALRQVASSGEEIDSKIKRLQDEWDRHHESKSKEIGRHRGKVEEIEARVEELNKLSKGMDEKHEQGLADFASSVELVGQKLREELQAHINSSDAQHREIRVLMPRAIEALDAQVAEGIRDAHHTFAEMHGRHQEALDRLGDGSTKLAQEMGQQTRDFESKTKELRSMHQSSLAQSNAALREEIGRTAREIDAEHRKVHANLRSAVESVDAKLREELARNSQDHDAKRDKIQATLMSVLDNMVSAKDALFREDLSRVSARSDKFDETVSKLRHGIDGLDRKVVELAHLASEGDQKHDDNHHALKLHVEDLASKLRHEMSRVADSNDQGHQDIREAKHELLQLAGEVAQLASQHEAKHEKADKCQKSLIASIDELHRTLESELAARSDDVAAEREVRTREVADICGAVQSLQSWASELEAMCASRNDARTRDLESLNTRIVELKEMHFAFRSETLQHQELAEAGRGSEFNKVTEELRRVVQDLSETSSNQGDQIKELESNLEGARGAKLEVHRLSMDLSAESTARSTKDSELQARLEREVSEMTRRIERLTGATTELVSDLRQSEARTIHVPGARHTPRTSRAGSLLSVDF